MQISAKRIALSSVVAGAAVMGLGRGVAAIASNQVSPEVASAHPAAAGHEGEGEYTAGDYRLHVHEVTDEGEGMGTTLEPGATYYSKTLHGNDSWRPTVVEFSVGADSGGPVVFRYPVPGPGGGVDCTASGTEAYPQVRCETTAAR